jgi:hypothetical protein
MKITITRDDLESAVNHGSVIALCGTTEAGKRVIFVGDHRPMANLLDGVRAEGEATADVASWQIMGGCHAGD